MIEEIRNFLLKNLIDNLPSLVRNLSLIQINKLLRISSKIYGKADNLLRICDSIENKDSSIYFAYNYLRIISKRRYNFISKLIYNNLILGNRLREKGREKFNIWAPTFLWLSLTHRCNLSCLGCPAPREEISINYSELKVLIDQSVELGIYSFVLIGGEPTLYKDLEKLLIDYPSVFFIIFSNGVSIPDKIIDLYNKQYNFFIFLSIDGNQEYCDVKRGKGVFQKIMESRSKLIERQIDHGYAITVCSENYDYVVSESYINQLLSPFSNIFIYFNYFDLRCSNSISAINSSQLREIDNRFKILRNRKDSYIIRIPEDEYSYYHRCLAAYDILHIKANGDVELCPFIQTNVHNVFRDSLLETLKKTRKIAENLQHINQQSNEYCLSKLINNKNIDIPKDFVDQVN